MIYDLISFDGSFKGNLNINTLILGIECGDIIQVKMEDNIFRFWKVLHVGKHHR